MRPKFLLKHLGFYFFGFMMMSNAVSSQDLVITGKIIEKNGSAIPGVSILLKGTNRGTTTDGNGAYKLSLLTEKSSLIFCYNGFTTQEIMIENRISLIILQLDETQQLNEVADATLQPKMNSEF